MSASGINRIFRRFVHSKRHLAKAINRCKRCNTHIFDDAHGLLLSVSIALEDTISSEIPDRTEDGAHKGCDHLARPGEAGEFFFGREALQVRHVDGGALYAAVAQPGHRKPQNKYQKVVLERTWHFLCATSADGKPPSL